MEALNLFLMTAAEETRKILSYINESVYEDAITIIDEANSRGGRLHITGIGKPSYVAGYMASLFSSVGIPAYFLHGTEAVHGSCGQLIEGDTVICISNSGETAELKATAMAVRKNGCKVIAVTGNSESWLAKFSDAHIYAGVDKEGGTLNRAPRMSIIAETMILQGLSVLLQERRGLTPQEYVMRHPGGALGVIRKNEGTPF